MIRNVSARISELIISTDRLRLADLSPRRQLGTEEIEEIAIDVLRRKRSPHPLPLYVRCLSGDVHPFNLVPSRLAVFSELPKVLTHPI